MIKSNIITYRSISNLWVTITTSSNPYIWILRDEWGLLCHLLPWGILMSSLLCVFSYGNHSCWKFRGLSGLSYLENGISCQRYKKLFMDSPKACSGCHVDSAISFRDASWNFPLWEGLRGRGRQRWQVTSASCWPVLGEAQSRPSWRPSLFRDLLGHLPADGEDLCPCSTFPPSKLRHFSRRQIFTSHPLHTRHPTLFWALETSTSALMPVQSMCTALPSLFLCQLCCVDKKIVIELLQGTQ